MERGKSGSMSRKSTISLGEIRPYFLRYMLNPLTDFKTADQWMSS